MGIDRIETKVAVGAGLRFRFAGHVIRPGHAILQNIRTGDGFAAGIHDNALEAVA